MHHKKIHLNKVNAVAIIPARGNSQGIPKKNIKHICGKPMIAYAIEEANKCRYIQKTFVTTDDAEISEVSRRYGAEVIARPKKISGSKASSETALIHALRRVESDYKLSPKFTAFIQCTSPLLTVGDIENVFKVQKKENADCVFTCSKFHHFLWAPKKNRVCVPVNHSSKKRILRQEMTPNLLEIGAVYLMKTSGFLKYENRFFGKICYSEMPISRGVEVDNPEDFDLAQHLLSSRNKISSASKLPKKIRAVIFDFDGVFTDNKVQVYKSGKEYVKCSRSDGLRVSQLKHKKIQTFVLTAEKNPIVKERCKKLDIICFQAVKDKRSFLKKWAKSTNTDLKNVVYLGNDINDIGAMKLVGCAVGVADSHEEVKKCADIVLEKKGGDGAVSELVDMIIQQKGGK